MPTYDYECTSCGYTFEHFQSMSDEPLKKCPECGKKLQRLIGGGTGVIFKGSGFYVNDNRSASKKSTSSSATGKDASSGAEKKSDTSADAGKSKESTGKNTAKKESA